MVFVSHEIDNLAQISDRVALIVGGRLVEIGEPARVIDRYRNRVLAA
jgi:ABC-type glutathione transport system ATPase component